MLQLLYFPNLISPHGIPLDLLDRLLIIPTEPYSSDDLKKIIKIRLNEEGVEVEPVVEELLSKICQKTSLRHTIHLISAADLVSNPFTFISQTGCKTQKSFQSGRKGHSRSLQAFQGQERICKLLVRKQ